jgi:hypothetical protein
MKSAQRKSNKTWKEVALILENEDDFRAIYTVFNKTSLLEGLEFYDQTESAFNMMSCIFIPSKYVYGLGDLFK